MPTNHLHLATPTLLRTRLRGLIVAQDLHVPGIEEVKQAANGAVDWGSPVTPAQYADHLTAEIDLVLYMDGKREVETKRALALACQRTPTPSFVVVAATVDAERAVALLDAGAIDYMQLDQLWRIPHLVAKVADARFGTRHTDVEPTLLPVGMRPAHPARDGYLTCGVSIAECQSLLLRFAQEALAGRDPAGLMSAAAQLARSISSSDTVSVLEIDDLGLVMRAFDGNDPTTAFGKHVAADTFPWYVAHHNGKVVVDDRGWDHPLGSLEFGDAQVVSNSIGVQIRAAGATLGVIVAHSRHRRTYDSGTVDALELLGSLLWISLMRTRGERALAKTDRHRTQLIASLVAAQETERHEIAGGIHDDAVQVMTAANMRLQTLRRHLTDPTQLDTARTLQENIGHAIGRLRKLMFNLSPPALESYGIASALRMLLRDYADEGAFESVIEADFPDDAYGASARIIVYRIAQEALANVYKHAKATHVTVSLRAHDNGCLVTISDNGIGLPTRKFEAIVGHIGVTSMRERAELSGGTWHMEGLEGVGTTVEYWIPDQTGQP